MEGFVRPDAAVLAEGALVPARNLVTPPPNRFTHRAAVPAPFFFGTAAGAKGPDGVFPQGTKVLLLVDHGGAFCRVVSEQGVYAEVEKGRLEQL